MGLRKQQTGLSLLLVIFILVALSVLATALVQILAVSGDAVAREVLSARALMAAESGAQRKLNQIATNGVGACSATGPSVEEDDTYDFDALAGCGTVSLTCRYETNIPVGSSNVYYFISSKGQCGPVGERATRTIEVQAKNIEL